jgi:type II secretory ATPase GspE/PulE/Tfp pilus assembly ATPase PilB-like protein
MQSAENQETRSPASVPAQASGTLSAGSESAGQQRKIRAGALREELAALIDVVGGPALVDVLLERAFELRATDIHLDPQETGLRTRIRVDGMLHDVLQAPTQVGMQMVSRLKLMANMDIAEKRLPQDGHFAQRRGDRRRDVRVATAPTTDGERVVLRLLPEHQFLTHLEDLGMDTAQADVVRSFLKVPYGMILSVGPVGSGKTTTMYSCLQALHEPNRSLATIEDPVEHRVPGVNQMQVDPRIDFTFAEGLRALLRQDPNVMMVGEIRDSETAHIAVRAGLTGVLVLSTMHANDSPGSVDVFHEFDVPSMLLADALAGVISQRLLRRVCPDCREAYAPSEAVCQQLGIEPGSATPIYRGRGCDACFNTGYFGRTGVFEIMPVDDAVRRAILRGAPRSEIREAAVHTGMATLQESAARNVRDGVTTVEEMHRVLTAFPQR